jgi:GT2 family glycosyltransferase
MDRDNLKVDILVIDNGSDRADYMALEQSVSGGFARIHRLEKNLGFTGGQNESLKIAIQENYDYVWMLNNDATVQPDTLVTLVEAISADGRCGAVSPVLIPEEGGTQTNAWGIIHDWKRRDGLWLASEAAARQQQQNHPESMCVAGTAVLLRVQALREVGLLDDRLFAYFDDNDIGARLSHRGWRSKVVFETTATHGLPALTDRPLYFFYLMFRNELIFWHTHMPKEFRKLLWLKLVNQALFNVNRLRRRGMEQQANSALLGVSDFIVGRTGAPDITRRVPVVMRLMCKASAYIHKKQLSNDKAGATAITDPMHTESSTSAG